MKTNMYLPVAAFILGISSIAASAQQSPISQAEANAANSVPVSAATAIAAVEKAANGKITELTLQDGGTNYSVTSVAADGMEANYVVDAKTGAVAQVAEAKGHHGDQEVQGEQENGEDGATDGGDGEQKD